MSQSITSKIIDAKNLDEMTALRDEVMKARDSKILKQWQDKWWAITITKYSSKCPTCGRVNK